MSVKFKFDWNQIKCTFIVLQEPRKRHLLYSPMQWRESWHQYTHTTYPDWGLLLGKRNRSRENWQQWWDQIPPEGLKFGRNGPKLHLGMWQGCFLREWAGQYGSGVWWWTLWLAVLIKRAMVIWMHYINGRFIACFLAYVGILANLL